MNPHDSPIETGIFHNEEPISADYCCTTVSLPSPQNPDCGAFDAAAR
jgi:hypothetical protein